MFQVRIGSRTVYCKTVGSTSGWSRTSQIDLGSLGQFLWCRDPFHFPIPSLLRLIAQRHISASLLSKILNTMVQHISSKGQCVETTVLCHFETHRDPTELADPHEIQLQGSPKLTHNSCVCVSRICVACEVHLKVLRHSGISQLGPPMRMQGWESV